MPQRGRKFATPDAPRQTLGKGNDRLFTVGRHKLLQGRKHSRMRKTLAVNAGEDRLGERLSYESERDLPVFAAESFVQRGICKGKRHRRRH